MAVNVCKGISTERCMALFDTRNMKADFVTCAYAENRLRLFTKGRRGKYVGL